MFPTSQQPRSSGALPEIPNGFPFPFLFRFPPPLGFGSIPPMMPPLPTAFASLLEARMRQIQSLDNPNDKVLSSLDKHHRKSFQRPTKQINFQLIDGKTPSSPINVLLRHTENIQALDKICESDEKCENLMVVAVSAADSVSHTVIYSSDQGLDEQDVLEIPENWKLLCHTTPNEDEANLSEDNTVLKPIHRGDEIIYFKRTTFDISNRLEQVSVSETDTLGNNASLSDANMDSRSESSSSIPPSLVKLETPNNLMESQLAPAAVGGYQCERCGKMFSYAYYRDKHLKYTRCVDQGDRKFPCPLCTRSFEKRDRLRIHILHVHENHRPHACNVCGKSFSQSSSLNKHLRVHSGERPYKCPFCTKSFTASSILRTHIRQHSGEKPFKCAFCGKSFASHAAHDSHTRRSHSNQNTTNLFKCLKCEKRFDHESHLDFHMQCFHSTD